MFILQEVILINLLKRAKDLTNAGYDLECPSWFKYFLKHTATLDDFTNEGEALRNYVKFDDTDIISVAKTWENSSDKVLSVLSSCVSNRHLFKVIISQKTMDQEKIERLENEYIAKMGITKEEAHYFFSEVTVSTNTYSHKNNNSPIYILYPNGEVKDIAEVTEILDISQLTKEVEKKYYFCYYNLGNSIII